MSLVDHHHYNVTCSITDRIQLLDSAFDKVHTISKHLKIDLSTHVTSGKWLIMTLDANIILIFNGKNKIIRAGRGLGCVLILILNNKIGLLEVVCIRICPTKSLIAKQTNSMPG